MQKRQVLTTFWLLSFSYFAHAEPLYIDTSQGRITFEVERATDLRLGLMHRTHLPKKNGMLFVYSRPLQARMWMKNTLIPLDMIFIRQNGEIESIHANAQPHSLDTIQSKGPVKAVLEINGGLSQKLGVMSGDRVIHSVFTADENRP